MSNVTRRVFASGLAALPLLRFTSAHAQVGDDMRDAIREVLVRRAYQYVAMFNTNNNFAMQKANPFSTNGWNKMFIPTGLTDHTLTAIPRPNNDTLYLISMLDMRDDAIVIDFPAFDSKYVSLETSAYDHYVDIPLATNRGDFGKRTKMLFYTERTKGYKGEPVPGIDKTLKMTGDFAIAFLRVAPHAAEPERMKRNLAAMQTQKLMTLSEFQGKPRKPTTPVSFPQFSNDEAVFKHNFLEVMQFVFNHTTFDPTDTMDQNILSGMKPFGVVPGKEYNPQSVAKVDGNKIAETAAKVQQDCLKIWNDPKGNPFLDKVFLPKGKMSLDAMVAQSAVGPIGLPYHQAQYPGVGTSDGSPLMADKHYIVRMTKDQLPPAKAFWSLTLYVAKTGLFIPNDGKKYSVGENGGMKLDASGGIEVHVAPTLPAGVPKENWLPSGGKEEALDIIMRVYDPDVEAMRTYKTPKAELVK
jgi:hypothetical protein